ncbi:MAG: hypothetical protein V2A65_02960 [Candidatus Omnitrophota bacterium]
MAKKNSLGENLFLGVPIAILKNKILGVLLGLMLISSLSYAVDISITTFPEGASVWGKKNGLSDKLIGNTPFTTSILTTVKVTGTYSTYSCGFWTGADFKRHTFSSLVQDNFPNGIILQIGGKKYIKDEITRGNLQKLYGLADFIKAMRECPNSGVCLGTDGHSSWDESGFCDAVEIKSVEITKSFDYNFIVIKKEGYENLSIEIAEFGIMHDVSISKNLIMTPKYFSETMLTLIANKKYEEAGSLRQYQTDALKADPTEEHKRQLAKLEKLVGLDNYSLMMLREKYVAAIDKEEYDKALKIKELIEKEEAQYKPELAPAQPQTIIVTGGGQGASGSTTSSGTSNVVVQQKPYYELHNIAEALETARIVGKNPDASVLERAGAGLQIFDVLKNLGK